jgi:hypothetical protein
MPAHSPSGRLATRTALLATLTALLALAGLLLVNSARADGARALGHAAVSTHATQVVGELTDAAAARLVPRLGEDRPDNAADNQREPTPAQLAAFRAHDTSLPTAYRDRVDGHYRGSTNQIITWAADKWGLNPDLLRAVAAVESWWHMYTVGDDGHAYGLFQIDVRYHADQALAANDTAFNADYYGAIIRSYYDGAQTWLNTVSGNGERYRAHDLWDSIGYWASGRWDVSSGWSYVHQVTSDLAERVWLQPSFDGR